MRRTTMWSLVLAIAVPPNSLAGQQVIDERGEELARETARRLSGYGQVSARMSITVRDPHGNDRVRMVRYDAAELKDGERTLLVFEEPKDVRGTALLSAARRGGDDDRWLYLPALNRIKRIAGAARSSAFMGTEFAYEDLTMQDAHRFRHRYLGEETGDSMRLLLVERVPIDPGSQYSRQVVRLDAARLDIVRVDYYDRRGEHLKTLDLAAYQLHRGGISRPGRMTMVNHRSGARTVIEWTHYQFTPDPDPSRFDPARLDRLR